MGGRGAGAPKNMKVDISNYNIKNPKKFDKREMDNVNNALTFITRTFGDISEYVGEIKKKYLSSASALHEHEDKYMGNPNRTTFSTDSFTTAETAVHEFTHAITEEIASKYKAMGYASRTEVLTAMRSECYQLAGKEEKKYDGRKWADRPAEFLSRSMEGVYVNSRENQHAEYPEKYVPQVIKKWRKMAGV